MVVNIVSALWHHSGWIPEPYFLRLFPKLVGVFDQVLGEFGCWLPHDLKKEKVIDLYHQCYRETYIGEEFTSDVMIAINLPDPGQIHHGQYRAEMIANELAQAFVEVLEYNEKGEKVGNLSGRGLMLAIELEGVTNGSARVEF